LYTKVQRRFGQTIQQAGEAVTAIPDNHPDRAGWLNESSRLKSLIPTMPQKNPILLLRC
jgi:hypothetical protein